MPDWLERRAAASPERLALIAPEGRWSFARLHEDAAATARSLTAAGIGPGSKVAVLLRNGAPYVRLTHGIGRAGAVMVPLNARLTPPEIAWQLEDVGADLLVYDEAHRDRVDALRPLLPRLAALSADATAGELGSPSSAPPVDLAATHTVMYTSGTTGKPKGARLTYGNHWWSAVASMLNLGMDPGDRWLACLPLFHIGGLSIIMRSAIYGITAVVHDGFDPARVNAAIDEQRVTIVSVVATMLQRMLEERGDVPYPDHLRCVLVGGGPVPEPLLEECARRNIPVVQTYGLTETASQAVTLSPADALRKLGSAGKPLLPNELRIVDADTGRDAPPGRVGEIVLRGPTVTPGYVRDTQDGRRALQGSWLHTGDLGYVDEEGYLYVVDRRDDLIITGGENVYPAEVEAALLAHPGVSEAGVTGLPDPRWGRQVAAAVVPAPGRRLDPEELRAFCAERLAGYKIPRRIIVVDALPRNAAGKLLRRALAPLFAPPS